MNKLSAPHARLIRRHGLAQALAAFRLNREQGEGCSTVGIYLGVHWRTADGLINAGEAFLRLPFETQLDIALTPRA